MATTLGTEKDMLAKLKLSGLTRADAAVLCLQPFTAEEVAKQLPELPAQRAGFAIPYFNLDGETTEFYRFRYLEYGTEHGFGALVATQLKQLRYAQPPETVNEIYLPPSIEWRAVSQDTSQSIVITEGELKAACACANGFNTMGLGGVWCFKAAKHGIALLPMFAQFKWTDRIVVICYDSDAIVNPMVMQAENALASVLVNLGAKVFIARLSPLADGDKCGIDDLIVTEGAGAFADVLKKAEPWAVSKELFALNEEVVYVTNPGLILRLDNMQRMAVRAFVDHAYATRKISQMVQHGDGTKLVIKSAPKEWVGWPHRATVKQVTFAPGQPRITADRELNCWTGWGCQPEEGEVDAWHEFMEYIFASETEHRRWFEQWLAYPLQHPGEKLYSAVVLWGVHQGTGKTLVGHTMFRIYGSNSTEIGDRDLYSSHNEWAEHKQFVVGDEITGGDKRNSADRMKSMITQRLLRLNPKYIPSYTVPDCINYLFTSNHPDAFFLEDTDRRFFIHELASRPQPANFYRDFVDWLDNYHGAERLFNYFLQLDLTGFDPQGHAPTTLSKEEMIASGRSDLGSWVANLREDPDRMLCIAGKQMPFCLWTTEELHRLYDPDGRSRATANGLAREMKRAGFRKVYDGMPVGTKVNGGQRLWAVRRAEELLAMGGVALAKFYDNERGGVAERKAKF